MPAAFTSSTVPGLAIWLDPTTGLSSSAGKATSWVDRSSFGMSFAPYDTTHAPGYTASETQTGKPCITLDGTQWLQGSSSTNGISAAGSGSVSIYVIASFENASPTQDSLLFSNATVYDNPRTGMVFGANASNQLLFFQGDGTNEGGLLTSSTSVVTVAAGIALYHIRTTTASNIELGRGGPVMVGTTGSSVGRVATGITTMAVGGGYGTTPIKPWQGKIFELLAYTQGLTAANQAIVQSYLLNRYNLATGYLVAQDPSGLGSASALISQGLAIPAQSIQGQGTLSGSANRIVVVPAQLLSGLGTALAGPLGTLADLGTGSALGTGAATSSVTDVVPLGAAPQGQGALTGTAGALAFLGGTTSGQGVSTAQGVSAVPIGAVSVLGQGRTTGEVATLGQTRGLTAGAQASSSASAQLWLRRVLRLSSAPRASAVTTAHLRARFGCRTHSLGAAQAQGALARRTHVALSTHTRGCASGHALLGARRPIRGQSVGAAQTLARQGHQRFLLEGHARAPLYLHLIGLSRRFGLRAQTGGVSGVLAPNLHRRTDTSHFPYGLTMARLDTGALVRRLGDTSPDLLATLESERGPLDLTDCRVVFRWYDARRGQVEERGCEVLQPASEGRVRHVFSRGDVPRAGTFSAHFLVTRGPNVRVHVPNAQSLLLCVRPERVTQAGT